MKKGKAYGRQRGAMVERTRIVAYFDVDERARVEQAAKAQRMSVSSYVATAALQKASYASSSLPPGVGRFDSLRAMRGIAKEAFAALGGGEEFLRRERAEFNEAMDKREAAILRELRAKH